MLALVFETSASSRASQMIFIATTAYSVNSSLVTLSANNSFWGVNHLFNELLYRFSLDHFNLKTPSTTIPPLA